MGHPKKQRSKSERPFKPYDKLRIEHERKLLSEYGMKRKNEIWRMEALLRSYRRRARQLLAKQDDKKKAELLGKLNKLGIMCSKLEDVLGVKTEDILSRRLQTILFKRNVTNSAKQARRLIVHGHVSIDGRRMLWPGYLVPVDIEGKIQVDAPVKQAEAKVE